MIAGGLYRTQKEKAPLQTRLWCCFGGTQVSEQTLDEGEVLAGVGDEDLGHERFFRHKGFPKRCL